MLGQGQGTRNFIRHFRLPAFDPEDNAEDDQMSLSKHGHLVLNVLEMLMALAFRSLTIKDCKEYSPGNVPPARSQAIHLNVMILLLQSSKITSAHRMEARQELSSSDDPEIRDVCNRTKSTNQGTPEKLPHRR